MSCINLNRIEFVITKACSGRCRHCSWGAPTENGGGVDADAAVSAVRRLASRFEIASVMTFGGEPLLFAETVCKIHAAARECGILRRQLITNGFFSKKKIDAVAKKLCDSGVNEILISVDAFHQEFIPPEPVLEFAEALVRHGILLFAHPAWVVNEAAENSYNAETKRLLEIFAQKGIRATRGNDILPKGSALENLAEFYPLPHDLSSPYEQPPDAVSCISITPDGGVHAVFEIGNIYNEDILQIIDNYEKRRRKNAENRNYRRGKHLHARTHRGAD